MKRKNLFFNMILISFICFTGLTGCLFDDSPTATIQIDSVSPNTNLIDGELYSFTVVVSYTISDGLGEINIGFNDSDSVTSYSIIDDKIVDDREGSESFIVETFAKDWGLEGDFVAYANISEYPHADSWSPLATDIMTLSF